MEGRASFEIEFQPVGKRVRVPASTSIFEAARNAGIDLASSCGGEGNCGLCQISILDGQVTSLTGEEEFVLSELERLRNMRLACCTWALSDLKIQIPKSSLVTGQRLQIASNLKEIDPEPVVSAYPLELARPTLHDARSDLTRILDGLREQYGMAVAPAEIL